MKLDTITVIKPTIKPTISIIPRSKPKISAAASGFGVGGTTQCAVVAPIVRHPVTYPILRSILEAIVIPIGIRIINVTSKNTGMDKINPAILKPQIAFFGRECRYNFICYYLSCTAIIHKLSKNRTKTNR